MLHIGASVGVAVAPDDGLDSNTLLKNADLALYRAKAEGRACFRFFEPGMDERMQARRSMEIDLRRALALKELQLVYQPQFSLATNRLVGFEALIRWHHPVRGIVSPSEFIPLAEEIGVVVPIGDWVLRTACGQAAAWPEPVAVAVNVSPLQFRNGKLLDTVVSALAHSGLPASRLEVEITEGALLDHAEEVLHVLNGLRDLGVSISMDDFGTGYSSLGYLQKFPLRQGQDRPVLCPRHRRPRGPSSDRPCREQPCRDARHDHDRGGRGDEGGTDVRPRTRVRRGAGVPDRAPRSPPMPRSLFFHLTFSN